MTFHSERAALIESVLVDRLTSFAELLRERGIAVGAHELMQGMCVLRELGFGDIDSVYWGLRLAMVRDSRHLDAFDEAFHEFWASRLRFEVRPIPAEPEEPPTGAAPPPEDEGDAGDGQTDDGVSLGMTEERSGDSEEDDDEEDEDDDEDPQERAAYSAVEVLRSKDFAEYTPEDHRRLVEMLTAFQNGGPWRRSRRKRRHRRGVVDIRRTVRAGFRTEGDPVRQLRQRSKLKHRRLTFVCDVSGSMEHYSRALLELAHVALVSRRRVEAFAFATRLTRMTRELLERDPAAAVTNAMESVVDWSGGTRVGDSIAELNRNYRASLQGAVVVIASDGWDLGEADKLAAEMAHLQRVAHHVIWLNPQKKDPAFEPLTRGMSSALPHVDDFVTCHNFVSFEGLLELLESV